jgi:WD40 repeat protein
VTAVAVAELDRRPVVVSGSYDRTVRVWDLATGTPVGKPFTGHAGRVYAVAVAELDGRPVVVSGSDDRTVRVWDLATGTPLGDPSTSYGGGVNAVACQTRRGFAWTGLPVHIGAGAGNMATVSGIYREADDSLRWERIAELEITSSVLALALTSMRVLVVVAQLGLIVIDLPSGPSAASHSW